VKIQAVEIRPCFFSTVVYSTYEVCTGQIKIVQLDHTIAPCHTNSELLPHTRAHEVSNKEVYLIIEALYVLDKILPHDSLDLFSSCNLKPMPIALPSFFLHALLLLRLALVMHIAEISLTRYESNNQAINQYFYFLDTCILFYSRLKIQKRTASSSQECMSYL
jgi:hypothetical protein